MLVTQNKSADSQLLDLPIIELSFPVIGQTLPADHGYGLYSAIAYLCSQVHQAEGLSIQTITGIPDSQGKIYLTERSRLRIRLPGDSLPLVYPLAGKSLQIGIHSIRLGIPRIFLLQPAPILRSRLVVIKGFQEAEPFLEAVQRQLDALEIIGNVSIPVDIQNNPERKTIKIKRFTIVGFAVEVSNLNEPDSLKLQTFGIGGKQRMGCGVFFPVKERQS